MESFLRPMLCTSSPEPPTGAAWVMEPKLDGWRAITWISPAPDGAAYLYARSGAAYSGKLPYIEDELLANLPADSALDGELIGKNWGDVQGVMTRGRGPHVPTPDVPALTYVVFDITRLNGNDLRAMPWKDRRSLLDQIEWDEFVVVNPADEGTLATHEQYLKLGYEGTVSKKINSRYSSNARGASWVKCKPQTTDEAKVVGFKPGEGEFAGMVGALEIEMLESGAATRCSGFDMDTRREITENPDRWLKTVIEIKHHGISPKTGKPRHPQFHRRRDDQAAPTETPRQRQIRQALAKTNGAEAKKKGEPEPLPPRMRNYKAMGDDKLLRVHNELRQGQGFDAYDRCMDGGSGEPMRDIAVVEGIMRERGLAVAP